MTKSFFTLGIVLSFGLSLNQALTQAPPAHSKPVNTQSVHAHAKKNLGVPHPFFWEITSPEGAKGYLFGTMHVPDERWEHFPETLTQTLDQADALYTEIDLRDKATLSSQLFARAMLKDQTLKDIIGAKLYDRLDRYLKTRGQSASYMSSFHPKMVEMTLGLLEIMPLMQSGKPALDEWLMHYAEKKGKIVGGVETVDEQLDALLGGTIPEAITSLDFTIQQLEKKSKQGIETIKLLMEVYFSGNEQRIDEFMRSELEGAPQALLNSMDRLLHKRNRVMAKRLSKLMKEHPKRRQVFAFGVAHFVGKGSVIELLQAQGYQVKRRFAPTH